MFPLALAVFLASGFAALLYQVVWQRMLTIFSGGDVYSATIIVAAFMGGLGVGHLAGGHVADRVARRASLVLFCAAEAAVALFGLVSAGLYYDVLYQRLGHLDVGRDVMAVVLFTSLLWPTFFMGASLPLLARALTARIERAASTVGALYGANTLGAALGALAGTWTFLPWIGLEGSLRVAVLLNVASAVVLLPLAFRLPGGSAALLAVSSAGETPAVSRAERRSVWFWMFVYGFAGFVALSLEIVWFRLLGIVMKSTAFTFGTLLAAYLVGTGLGAVAGSVLAPRVRRPAGAFLGLQAAGGLVAALLLLAFLGLAADARALRDYFAGYDALDVRASVHALAAITTAAWQGQPPPVDVPANFLRLYVAVPLLIILPPTFLMGCSFPFLQRVVQTDLARLGRRVGLMLVANILGSLLGTVLTGWLLLAWLGTAGTLRLLAASSGLFVALWVFSMVRGFPWPVIRPAAAATAGLAAAVPVAAAMPDGERLWALLHGTTGGQIIVREDGSGVSLIKLGRETPFDSARVVYANGLGQSQIPYAGIHTALGALPAFVHPSPRSAAIVGLGSGATTYAVAGRPELERITAVEIVGSQLPTLRALAVRDEYEALHALLHDPRIEHVVGDGRSFLMRADQGFDIIEADALRPTSAYSGNLYSEAYFALVKSRLNPGGLAATWNASRRVHDTFVKVFPYVVSVPGLMLGSTTPIPIDPEGIAARLADPRVRHHYARAGIDIEALIGAYLEGEWAHFGPDFPRETLTDVNTDLFPKDEFDLGRGR